MVFQDRSTKVGRSTSNKVSSEKKVVRLRLKLKDGSKGLILNLIDMYYLL